MTFAEKIKEYAEVNGLSYFAIGKAAGMSESTVYEVVKKGVASPRTIKKIADTFGGEFSDYVIKKKCGDCGAEFYPDSYRSIRCESCVAKAKERKRVYKKHGLEVECFKQPKLKTSEVETKARKRKMSYGHYIAMERLKGAAVDKR